VCLRYARTDWRLEGAWVNRRKDVDKTWVSWRKDVGRACGRGEQRKGTTALAEGDRTSLECRDSGDDILTGSTLPKVKNGLRGRSRHDSA